MWRSMLSIFMVAATLSQVPAARADLFDDARTDGSRAAVYYQDNTRLMDVRSDMAVNTYAYNNVYPAVYSDTAATPAAASNVLQLPAEVQPWGWSWFPFYQCSLVYWRPTQVGPVPMSSLEKLDTFAHNNGNGQPFAAAFEACDARPWVSQAKNLPAGHNLTKAYYENGQQTTIPWQASGGSSRVDISWWGHCNGWAAAAVSFPESKLPGRQVPLQKNEIRYLNRPEYEQMGADNGGRGGGLIGLYQQYSGNSMYIYTEDLKCMLTEYGMQLRPNPAFSSGRRYDAPSADIDEYFFERRADGTVIIPQDATLLWVALVFDGQTVGGWQIPRGYPESNLQQWRVQLEQTYRYYYPGHQIYTMCTARYTNLPLQPTEDDLRDMPPLVRKGFLDVDPLEFHAKATAAFNGQSGKRHALICEVSAGSQIWNFPMKQYAYNMSQIQQVAYNPNATFARGANGDANSLFNLARLSASRLPVVNGQRVLKYRVGTMRVTLQKVSETYDENYQFFAFYDQSDASIGAVWAGQSLTKHPDFVWYPDLDNPGSPQAGNPYVRAADLKALLPELPIR